MSFQELGRRDQLQARYQEASLDSSGKIDRKPANPNRDDWQSHDGLHDIALHGDTPVEVRFRDGDTALGIIYDWDQNWQWARTEAGRKAPGAIVAWRVRKEVKPPARGLMDAAPAAATEDDMESIRFNETMQSKTPRQVLAAVRRLMPRNKKPNFSLAMDVFSVGSTYGYRICREAGIDPYGTTLTAFDTPNTK